MLRNGDIICLMHFLTTNPLRCEIIDNNDNSLVLRTLNHFTTLNFFEEDEIAIGFEYQRRPYFANARITEINKIGTMTINVDFDNVFDNRGAFEKYPVSFSGETKRPDDIKTQSAVICSVDYSYIVLISKIDYQLNEELDVIVHTNFDVMKQKAEVIYKESVSNNKYKYELRFVNLDYKIVDRTKQLLQTLVRENEKVVRRLKEEL